MPEISRFYGIIIRMYYNEHNPPHFHAYYGDSMALIGIESLSVINGGLPPRALGLVVEWAALHQGELLNIWNYAQQQQPLGKISPLP